MTDKHVNAVRERPILFSKPMVLALLAGTKTQTRRIVKPELSEGFSPSACEIYHPCVTDKDGYMDAGDPIFGCYDRHGEDEGRKCPYGAPGDRLWVKETHARIEMSQFDMIAYRATAGEAMVKNVKKWTPSIFMPRKLSRITLEIESVRVERLQDISEEDAKAEGCDGNCPIGYIPAYQKAPFSYHYAQIWESINGPGSWALNPWVWALTFHRLNPDPAKQ